MDESNNEPGPLAGTSIDAGSGNHVPIKTHNPPMCTKLIALHSPLLSDKYQFRA